MTGVARRNVRLAMITINGKLEILASASQTPEGNREIQMKFKTEDGQIRKEYFPEKTIERYYQNKYPGSEVKIIYK